MEAEETAVRQRKLPLSPKSLASWIKERRRRERPGRGRGAGDGGPTQPETKAPSTVDPETDLRWKTSEQRWFVRRLDLPGRGSREPPRAREKHLD